MRRHRLIGRASLLVVLACAPAIFWSSLLCAQDRQMGTINDQLVGNWMLVSITTHVGTKSFSQGQPMPTVTVKDVQPYGANPKGKLIFEQNGRFASTIVNSDRSRSASNDPNAPAEFEASSGTYSIHPSRPKTVIFEIEPSSDRKSYAYVEISTLTAKELEFRTMAPPGGVTESSIVYRRAE
jgi:Lipocalin-like domain